MNRNWFTNNSITQPQSGIQNKVEVFKRISTLSSFLFLQQKKKTMKQKKTALNGRDSLISGSQQSQSPNDLHSLAAFLCHTEAPIKRGTYIHTYIQNVQYECYKKYRG